MAPSSRLQEAKRRVAAAVLSLDAVSGVGISGGQVVVYLADSSDAARQAVTAKLAAVTPPAPVKLVVSGPFERRDRG
jgi:hypothetical protein